MELSGIRACSVEESERIAEHLGAEFPPGSLLSLEGPLGAGKTVFVRGLARGLGHDAQRIASPTFVLAIEHVGGRIPLLHVDLYRLPEGSGIDELGVEEAIARGFVVAVEWGQRLPDFLREEAWRLMIALGESDDERVFTLLPPAGQRPG